MATVPGLRSIYQRVGRLIYFGRMLDKIRLHAAGRLPPDYQGNLGTGFDGRCCAFLAVAYDALKTRTLAGATDEELLAWCHQQGGERTDEQYYVWNRFMMKLGWRDDRTPALQKRVADAGLTGKPIETMFDFIEFDEGRGPISARSWELRD